MTTAVITLIGGPTALIEVDGFRLLTDPTFDDPGDGFRAMKVPDGRCAARQRQLYEQRLHRRVRQPKP